MIDLLLSQKHTLKRLSFFPVSGLGTLTKDHLAIDAIAYFQVLYSSLLVYMSVSCQLGGIRLVYIYMFSDLDVKSYKFVPLFSKEDLDVLYEFSGRFSISKIFYFYKAFRWDFDRLC